MNISLIIRDLLLRNEQLVIPGFGTFKILHQPARISKTTQLLMPPSRDIVFDNKLRSGDNQLILSIKKKQGLSESETEESLKKYINNLEAEIQATGSVTLEGLGKIQRDNSGNLKFEPIGDLLNPGGVFALPKLEIPVAPTTTIPKADSVSKYDHPLPGIRRRRRWWIPAAALIVLATLISIAYFTGIISNLPGITPKKEAVVIKGKDQNRIVFGNRETARKDTIRDTTTRAISRQLDQRTERENALRFDEKKKEVPKTTADATPKIKPTIPAGPYQIISGSFTVIRNAERQIMNFRKKGLNAELLPRNGKYYMVTLGSYPTLLEANTAMDQLKEQLNQDLWVMKTVTRD